MESVQTIHTIRGIIEKAAADYPNNVAFRVKEKNDKGIKSIDKSSYGKYYEKSIENGIETCYRDITYTELYNDIRVLGNAFLSNKYEKMSEPSFDKGIDRGESKAASDNEIYRGEENILKVAIIGQNSYEWALCYYATVCVGGVSVPLDKGLPREEVVLCLKRSGAQIMIYDDSFEEMMNEIKDEGELPEILFINMNDLDEFILETIRKRGELKSSAMDFDDGAQSDILKNITKDTEEKSDSCELYRSRMEPYDQVKITGDDLCAILFTSGTTSNSKAVMLTNDNIASNIYALNLHIKFYESDVNMAFLPFHHTFGNTSLLLFLSCGATNVFCDGLKYIQQNLNEYGVSVFVTVPLLLEGIYSKVIKQAKKRGEYRKLKKGIALSNVLMKFGIDRRRQIFSKIHAQFGGRMRQIISGASAINPDVAKAYNDIGIALFQGYGLTETSPVVSGECVGRVRRGSIGIPLQNLKVMIENPDERGIGEIIVKGPSVMRGYYADPVETNRVLKNGWFHTGDLGYMKKDGQLYLTGRKKNVIVLKNGKNVYPEELESRLLAFSFVAEAIVYGAEKGEDLVVSAKIVYNESELCMRFPAYYDRIMKKDMKSIEMLIKKEVDLINDELPQYKRIKRIVVTDKPMEKTTTAKIKRYKAIAECGIHNA